MEQTIPVQSGSNHPIPLEIPWMKRWEKADGPERAPAEEDHAARRVRIDYMTMLEELEFR